MDEVLGDEPDFDAPPSLDVLEEPDEPEELDESEEADEPDELDEEEALEADVLDLLESDRESLR